MTPVVASGPPSSRARIRFRLGPDDVAEHAEDMDLELLDAVAFEHGAADAFHAGSDFLDAA